MKDDGGPAFPTHAGADYGKHENDPTRDDPRNQILGGGMTLRDWFAGHALAGILANPEHDSGFKTISDSAYGFADEMLAARKGGA